MVSSWPARRRARRASASRCSRPRASATPSSRRGGPRRSSRRAAVAAHDEPPGLCHERAHRADVAADDDVDALHRDAAAHRGAALDTSSPPCPVAPSDCDASPRTRTDRTSCSPRRRADAAVHGDVAACSCPRSSSRRDRALDRLGCRSPAAIACAPPDCTPRRRRAGSCSSAFSSRTVLVARSTTLRLGRTGTCSVLTAAMRRPAPVPARRSGPTRYPAAGQARNSDAMATQSSVSAIIAGLQAKESRTTAELSPLVTSSVKNPSKLLERPASPCRGRRPWPAPRRRTPRPPRSRCPWRRRSLACSPRRIVAWLENARCAPDKVQPTVNG